MARILLIDDESSIRLFYSDVLAEEGHHVMEAMCGREALTLIETDLPELVLLDIEFRPEDTPISPSCWSPPLVLSGTTTSAGSQTALW